MFGIEKLEKRVDQLEKDVARIENIIAGIATDMRYYDGRLTTMDRATQERLNQFEEKLNGIMKEIQRLDSTIHAIKQDIAKYWQHQNNIERKIMEVESTMESNAQYWRKFERQAGWLADVLRRMRRFQPEVFENVAAAIRALQGGDYGEGDTGTGT